jgi:hypothetical protein
MATKKYWQNIQPKKVLNHLDRITALVAVFHLGKDIYEGKIIKFRVCDRNINIGR